MKKFLAIILAIIMVASSLPSLITNAENANKSIVFVNDTFTMYKDGEFYRFTGPTGNADENFSSATSVISSAKEYYEAHSIKAKDIAMTGSENLPSSVDLSSNKYFPPVGNQAGLGSCATFSSVYYQFSYAVNENCDVQATYENTRSPQIVYNFINAGSTTDTGTWYGSNYDFLRYFGAPTMKEVPYSDADFLNWHTYEGVWREGIRARLKDYFVYDDIGIDDKQITSPDDPDLDTYKTALNEGKLLGYSTYVYSWKTTTLKQNPDAPENDKYAGEYCVTVCDGTDGAHAMTIVGYNDDIWTDINNNNKVDSGEMGAFKIVNSWGDGYCNDGFVWIAYDALNKVSCVDGVDNSNRIPIFEYVRSITVRDYNDLSDIYIKYTLNTSKRTQHEVVFTAEKDGTVSSYEMFYGSGGGYKNDVNEGAFDGTDVACDGVFVCPIDNIAKDFTYEDFDSYNFSIEFKDTKEDSNPLIVKDVQLVNELTGKTYKVADNLPSTLDGNSATFNIKEATKSNKVIYYVGYDNPTLHYKVEGGEFRTVKMEENFERIGATHKYVLQDTTDDVILYFSDDNDNIDDNGGKYYTAKNRLNFYRTQGVRDTVTITDVTVPEGYEDTGIRFFFETEITGGYEPFNYQYLIENTSTGDSTLIEYDYKYEKSYVFYNAGNYNVTVEVTDQAGDVFSFTKNMEIVDLPFTFSSFVSNTKAHLVGDTSSFTASTIYEKIISRGPQQSKYKFDVKDDTGELVYTQTNESFYKHLGLKQSIVNFEYIPEKAGEYTLTVSSTDDSKEYAEITLAFTVYDKVIGDSNADGSIKITDATNIQRYLASLVTEEDIYSELSDCNASGDISVVDATLIQRYLASLSNTESVGKIIEYIPPQKPTEPPTEEPTEQPTEAPSEPPVTQNKVTFTNSFNWSGTIYCYYWSDENTSMTSWPGVAMTNIGPNDYNEVMYTFVVPENATHIIFSNGSEQTTDIDYNGGEVRYYPVSETDSNGKNLVKIW